MDYNDDPMCVIVEKRGQAEQRVPLRAGPHGFLVWTNDKGEQVVTEVPNSMLAAKAQGHALKKPAAARKKPAAEKKPAGTWRTDETDEEDEASQGDEEDTDEEDEASQGDDAPHQSKDEASRPAAASVPAPVDGRGYNVMWYKRSHSVAIRRKHADKAQLAQFGGATYKTVSEQKLREIADAICKELVAGTIPERKDAVLKKAASLLANR